MATSDSIQKVTRDVLVFKTDISTDNDVRNVAQLLREETRIKKWTIDRNDIDNVLRIESLELAVEEIALLVKQSGYRCEELED